VRSLLSDIEHRTSLIEHHARKQSGWTRRRHTNLQRIAATCAVAHAVQLHAVALIKVFDALAETWER